MKYRPLYPARHGLAVLVFFALMLLPILPATVPSGPFGGLCGLARATDLPIFPGLDMISLEPVSMTHGMGLRVGAGPAFEPDYEGSDDYDAVPLLMARLDWSGGPYVEFLGNRIIANLMTSDTWEIGPLLRYRSSRSSVSDTRVDDLSRVDGSMELGAMVGYSLDPWHARATFAQDFADGHDGYLIRFGVGWSEGYNDLFRLSLNGYVSYANDDYMEAYYEVSPGDAARSGLRTYEASSNVKDLGLIGTLDYSLTESLSVVTLLGYLRLIGDAEDSPVVDDHGDPNQIFGGLILTYGF